MQNMCKGIHFKYKPSVKGFMLKPTYSQSKKFSRWTYHVNKKKKKKKEKETVDANVVEVEPTTSAISYLKVYQR